MNKVLLFIVLLTVLVWLLFKSTEEVDENSSGIESEHVTQPVYAVEKQQSSKQKKTSKTIEEKAKVLAEQDRLSALLLDDMKVRLFSDDPYVEMYSLQNVIGICEEPSEIKSFFTSMTGIVTEEQQQQMEKLLNRCTEYQKRYPNLLDIKSNKTCLLYTSDAADD